MQSERHVAQSSAAIDNEILENNFETVLAAQTGMREDSKGFMDKSAENCRESG